MLRALDKNRYKVEREAGTRQDGEDKMALQDEELWKNMERR